MPATVARPDRLAALVTLLLATVLLVQLPAVWRAAPWLGLLDALAAVAATGMVARLWWWGRAECRVLATALVTLVLAGQLVAVTVGFPGASALGGFGWWSALALTVDAVSLAVVVRSLVHCVR